MGQQAVVAETDAEAAGGPAQSHADRQPRPGEVEGGHQGGGMDETDPDDDRPIEVAPVLARRSIELLGIGDDCRFPADTVVPLALALGAADR